MRLPKRYANGGEFQKNLYGTTALLFDKVK